MVNYDEFKESAETMTPRRAADLFRIDPADYGFDEYDSVIVYMESCYIGKLKGFAGYHLLIENREWDSICLSDLEPILYEWYNSAIAGE